jgi:hypothetical protein
MQAGRDHLMTRNANINYQADPPPTSTQFVIPDSDNDVFDRNDITYLARALDLHDHTAGRGLPAARAAASSIDTAALQNLAVSTGKIADAAITAPKIAANAVVTAGILDLNVTGAKLALTAVTDRLGYTPINKAGDSGIGSLSLAPGGSLFLSASSTVNVPAGASVNGAGVINLAGGAGTRATFTISDAPSIAAVFQNTGANPGYGLGVLNAIASGWDLLVSHLSAVFSIPVQATSFASSAATGTAPFTSASTTMCSNLNAQYLGGQPLAYFGRATNEVPAAMNAFFWSAGFIPAGTWARNTSADGRIIVGAGTTFTVTFNENAQSGGSWSHDHVGDDHTHTITGSTSASTGAQAGATPGGLNVDALGHVHPLTATAAANHATTGAYAWAYPVYSLVMAYKT